MGGENEKKNVPLKVPPINVVDKNSRQNLKTFTDFKKDWQSQFGIEEKKFLMQTLKENSLRLDRCSRIVQFVVDGNIAQEALNGNAPIEDIIVRKDDLKIFLIETSSNIYACYHYLGQSFYYTFNNPDEISLSSYADFVTSLPETFKEDLKEKIRSLYDPNNKDFFETYSKSLNLFGLEAKKGDLKEKVGDLLFDQAVVRFYSLNISPNTIQATWRSSASGKIKVLTTLAGSYSLFTELFSIGSGLYQYNYVLDKNKQQYFDGFLPNKLHSVQDKTFYNYYQQSLKTCGYGGQLITFDNPFQNTSYVMTIVSPGFRKFYLRKFVSYDFSWKVGTHAGAFIYAGHSIAQDRKYYDKAEIAFQQNQAVILGSYSVAQQFIRAPYYYSEKAGYRNKLARNYYVLDQNYKSQSKRNITRFYKLHESKNKVFSSLNDLSSDQRSWFCQSGDYSHSLYQKYNEKALELGSALHDYNNLKDKSSTEAQKLLKQIHDYNKKLEKIERKIRRIFRGNKDEYQSFVNRYNKNKKVKLFSPKTWKYIPKKIKEIPTNIKNKVTSAPKNIISKSSAMAARVINETPKVVRRTSFTAGRMAENFLPGFSIFAIWCEAHGSYALGAQGLMLKLIGPTATTFIIRAGAMTGKAGLFALWGYCFYRITDVGILRPLRYRENLSYALDNTFIGKKIVQSEVARQHGVLKQWMILQVYKPELDGYEWGGITGTEPVKIIKKQNITFNHPKLGEIVIAQRKKHWLKNTHRYEDIDRVLDKKNLIYVEEKDVKRKRLYDQYDGHEIVIEFPFSASASEIKVNLEKYGDNNLKNTIKKHIVIKKKNREYKNFERQIYLSSHKKREITYDLPRTFQSQKFNNVDDILFQSDRNKIISYNRDWKTIQSLNIRSSKALASALPVKLTSKEVEHYSKQLYLRKFLNKEIVSDKKSLRGVMSEIVICSGSKSYLDVLNFYGINDSEVLDLQNGRKLSLQPQRDRLNKIERGSLHFSRFAQGDIAEKKGNKIIYQNNQIVFGIE